MTCWGHCQTNFLAMKKSLSRFICQKPTDSRIQVWTTAHHRTLLLVSSLICRNTSSFSCQETFSKQSLHVVLLWQVMWFWNVDSTVKRVFTLWYSWCLVMNNIWSLRWLRLFSKACMLSLVFAELWSTGCSPIWMSKCSFCKWMKEIAVKVHDVISLYCSTVGILTLGSLFSPASLQHKQKTALRWFGNKRSADQSRERWR